MSTLRTRIAGFPFVIVEESDGRKTGMFRPNVGTSVMDLPYELRSTYSQREGQTLSILIAAVSDAEFFNHYHFVNGQDVRCADLHHCPSICGCDADNCDFI